MSSGPPLAVTCSAELSVSVPVRNLLLIYMSPHRPAGRALLLAAHIDCVVFKELAATGRYKGWKENRDVVEECCNTSSILTLFLQCESGVVRFM